ncbi:MAG: sigma-70 family RNA polymerase sigma factor [Candidatus Tectomicrobia bacterium]|nr:sigma-70 family RNA polymerase sigma factor [Candidatus Tectomicrobia bacterium]
METLRSKEKQVPLEILSHWDELFQFLKKMTGDGDTARDLCQDVFLKALQVKPIFHDADHVKAWLYTVARHHALNYFRHLKVHETWMTEQEKVGGSEESPSELGEIVAEVLFTLPERYRQILILKELEGFSYDELSATLHLSQSAVTSLLSRARERFKHDYRLRVSPMWARTLSSEMHSNDLLEHIDPFHPSDDLKQELQVEILRYFTLISREWDEIRAAMVGERSLNWLFDHLALSKEMMVVDLGTGTGYIARALAPFVGETIGIDNNREMLDLASQKSLEDGLSNIRFLRGELEDIPLDDHEADLVCCHLALHHAVNPLWVLKEIHRILKVHGQILLIDFTRHKNRTAWQSMRDLWLGFDPSLLMKSLEKIGFTALSLTNDLLPSQDQLHSFHSFPALFYISGIKKSE